MKKRPYDELSEKLLGMLKSAMFSTCFASVSHLISSSVVNETVEDFQRGS